MWWLFQRIMRCEIRILKGSAMYGWAQGCQQLKGLKGLQMIWMPSLARARRAHRWFSINSALKRLRGDNERIDARKALVQLINIQVPNKADASACCLFLFSSSFHSGSFSDLNQFVCAPRANLFKWIRSPPGICINFMLLWIICESARVARALLLAWWR